MTDTNSELRAGGKLLLLAGSTLIILAVAVLVLLGVLIFQMFYQPEQVQLIQYLMETITPSDKAFYGRVDNSDFFVHISDPIKYFLYFMAIFLILSIVVKMFSSILSAGVGLIKTANGLNRNRD